MGLTTCLRWKLTRRVLFRKWLISVRLLFLYSDPLLRLIQWVMDCWRSADQNGMMGSMMQDLAFAIPGVDEAMSFAEIMKYVNPSLLFATLFTKASCARV